MPVHATRRGRAGVQIEVRQDLIADEAGIGRWAGILGEALAEVFEDPALYEPAAAPDPRGASQGSSAAPAHCPPLAACA